MFETSRQTNATYNHFCASVPPHQPHTQCVTVQKKNCTRRHFFIRNCTCKMHVCTHTSSLILTYYYITTVTELFITYYLQFFSITLNQTAIVIIQLLHIINQRHHSSLMSLRLHRKHYTTDIWMINTRKVSGLLIKKCSEMKCAYFVRALLIITSLLICIVNEIIIKMCLVS